MLKSFSPYLLVVILSLVFTTASVNHAHSQPPPPPPGGTPGSGGHNLNANQGAPLGEGIWILITLAVSYGLNRHIRNREHKTELAGSFNRNTPATAEDYTVEGTKAQNFLSALTGFFSRLIVQVRKLQ